MSHSEKHTQNTPVSMGLGPLGNPTTIFARCFRWTLDADHCCMNYLMDRLKVSFKHKKLKFFVHNAYLEGQDTPVPAWLESIESGEISEKMTLTLYDGCGNPLEKHRFDIVAIGEQSMSFDYSKNGTAQIYVELSFSNHEREFCIEKKEVKDDAIREETVESIS